MRRAERRAPRWRCTLPLVAALAGALPLVAQQQGVAAAAVFRRYADHVVKIEISETGSAAKASLGSGFFVSDRGHIVTNYHVISQLVHDPDRYRAELVDARGEAVPVVLLAIDVVHDLAVVRADLRPAHYFSLGAAPVDQGDRLYSLGHPKDLGLSIVEGTYNGLLQHTLYPKIHFTGSLNPGVSGGPAITADGRVVGINVSTEGNQVSFLVPAERAIALLDAVLSPGYAPPASFLAAAGRQILAYQDAYLREIFAVPVPTVTIGRYKLPTRPAPFFKCWADAMRERDTPYEQVDHVCSTDDYVYISEGQWSGVVEMHHRVLTSAELNPFRFYSLYESSFADESDGDEGREEDVTAYRCSTRDVRRGKQTLRAVFCLRRYRKFAGLYDVVVRGAALGAATRGMVTTLTLSGVSYENAEQVARRYLESISWID